MLEILRGGSIAVAVVAAAAAAAAAEEEAVLALLNAVNEGGPRASLGRVLVLLELMEAVLESPMLLLVFLRMGPTVLARRL
jgi:hypothetical protein